MQGMHQHSSLKESKKLKLVLLPHPRCKKNLTEKEVIAQKKMLSKIKYSFSNNFSLFEKSKVITSMKFPYSAIDELKKNN
tara:strand:+ start:131 stop:370 length:240 start_codon:yes stop_codon:yes gene_type:complete